MAGVRDFSEKVIDYAERLSDVADAAQGKHRRPRGLMRWALPASGAAALALVRSDFFTRRAKETFQEAKTRASDLPDDLMTAVRHATGDSRSRSSQAAASSRSTSSSTRKTAGRKRTTARKRASASR